MANNVLRTRLAIAAESTFANDPDGTGATYAWVRLFGDSTPFLEDLSAILETNYWVGRNATTPHEIGNDGAALNFETPVIGFPTAVGGAQLPPTDDYQDLLWNCAFGANTAYTGTTVTSATATTVTTAANNFNVQDLIACRDAGAASPYMQWRRSSSANSPYTVHRAWDATPSATGICHGYKGWRFLDPGGLTLSALYDLDGTQYTISGGRVLGMKLSLPSGQLAKMSYQTRWNQKTQLAKGSLPALTAWTGTPIKGQLASVEWGGTIYPAKLVEVDFGLAGSDSESVGGIQGRGNIENLMSSPLVTVQPLFATGWENDFRVGTQRNLMIRYGAGQLAAGAVNSLCFFAENAQVIGHKLMNDNKRLRQAIQIRVRDGGIFAGSTPSRLWQLARA